MEQRKVIIADDEQRTRRGIAKNLPWSQLGCQLAGTAENGKQALELVRQTGADIVISDIRMPNMNGLELIRRLEQEFPQTDVIFISAYSDFSYAHRALRSSIVQDYLLKPVDMGDLCNAINNVLNRNNTQKSADMEICDFDGIFAMVISGDIANALELMERQWDAHTIGVSITKKNVAKQASAWIIRLSWLLAENGFEPDAGRYAGEYAKKVYSMEIESMGPYCIQRTREAALQVMHAASLSPLVRTSLNIIDQRFTEKNFSLFSLASEMMVSANHLSTCFKNEMGIGFVKYLQSRRIEETKRLLLDVRLKAYEIANRVGFEDQRYFARLFKEYTGMTPSEYRQSVMLSLKNSEK